MVPLESGDTHNSRRGFPPDLKYPTSQVFEPLHTRVQHNIAMVTTKVYRVVDDERFSNWARSADTQLLGHKDHAVPLHEDVLDRQATG